MCAGISLPVAFVGRIAPRKQRTTSDRDGIRRNGCLGGGKVVVQRAISGFSLSFELLIPVQRYDFSTDKSFGNFWRLSASYSELVQ
jgi:hypothetical protein